MYFKFRQIRVCLLQSAPVQVKVRVKDGRDTESYSCRPKKITVKMYQKIALRMPKKTTTAVKQQTFSFYAPEAVSVQLVGDFTNWQANPISLKRQPNGVWTTTVPLPPGTHHYRFLVDGQWRDDPECTVRVPNPFGSTNSVRVVR